jgi:hypothetical protein
MITKADFKQAILRAVKNGPDDLAKDDDPTAFIEAVADAFLTDNELAPDLQRDLIRRAVIAEITVFSGLG